MAAQSLASRTPEADPVSALHNLVLASLEDDQAIETVSIPLEGKSSIADHMVIASGRSTRQVASMAQKLVERMKGELGRQARLWRRPTCPRTSARKSAVLQPTSRLAWGVSAG